MPALPAWAISLAKHAIFILVDKKEKENHFNCHLLNQCIRTLSVFINGYDIYPVVMGYLHSAHYWAPQMASDL